MMPPPGTILSPSHLIQAQVVNILRQSGVELSRQRIYQLCKKGGPLSKEDWYGCPMVAMWKVIQYLDGRKP